jgi:hypothetical protein
MGSVLLPLVSHLGSMGMANDSASKQDRAGVMATLITVGNSGGVKGRCDAKCYNGKLGGTCNCICGGANHGVGEAKAVDNVRQYTQARLDELRAKGAHVPDSLKQGSLF